MTAFTDPRIDAYLGELDRALAELPWSQRRDLVDEVESHIRAELDDGQGAVVVEDVLTRLGDPYVIAGEAMERLGGGVPVVSRTAPEHPASSWELAAVAAMLAIAFPLNVLQALAVSEARATTSMWIQTAIFCTWYAVTALGLVKRQRWAWISALVAFALASIGGVVAVASGVAGGLFNAILGPAALYLLLRRTSRQSVGAL
jgi:uncharacterized membrane protein